MKIKELIEKGIITQSELNEHSINIARVIVDQEFNKRHPHGDSHEIALERLLHLQVPFTSEWNIDDKLLNKVVQFKCPYDGTNIEWSSAGGNVDTTTFTCTCPKCGAKVSFTMNYDAISIDPPSPERVASIKARDEAIKAAKKKNKR